MFTYQAHLRTYQVEFSVPDFGVKTVKLGQINLSYPPPPREFWENCDAVALAKQHEFLKVLIGCDYNLLQSCSAAGCWRLGNSWSFLRI